MNSYYKSIETGEATTKTMVANFLGRKRHYLTAMLEAFDRNCGLN